MILITKKARPTGFNYFLCRMASAGMRGRWSLVENGYEVEGGTVSLALPTDTGQ